MYGGVTMTTDPKPENPEKATKGEPERPVVETAGGQHIGETEKNARVPEPIGRPWWKKLLDKIMMR